MEKNSKTDKKISSSIKVYEGHLDLGGIQVPCFVTPDGKRLLATRRLQDVMKVAEDRADGKIAGTRWARFLGFEWLNSLLDKDFDRTLLEPNRFKTGKRTIVGYRAELIPELCNVILRARREGKLTTTRQTIIAEQCEILSSSLAKVGIVALVDEATGYQFDRKYDALRILLNAYISESLQKWVKRFPDEFFAQLDKLYNNTKTISRNRPSYYGVFINTYIYEPIEDGYVKMELNKKNIRPDGSRKARFHQWLTSDFGVQQLSLQIGRVLSVMEDSSSIRTFKERMKRKASLSIQPELFEMLDDYK